MVLSVPASSSPVERTFSSLGSIVTNKRTSLEVDTLKSIFLVKHHWNLLEQCKDCAEAAPQLVDEPDESEDSDSEDAYFIEEFDKYCKRLELRSEMSDVFDDNSSDSDSA